MKKPTVLLTNDDGIWAPGLRHLWNALKDTCDIYIAAPSIEKSGMGTAVTLNDPIHIKSVSWPEGTPAWEVSGTPADCVRMALNALLPKPIDAILSGINRGENSGRNIFYSGTIGGVIDGAIRNIPGIAFSCQDYDDPSYEHFEPCIFPLLDYLLKHPLPGGSFLNVNFPSQYKTTHKGYRLARQGMGYYKEDPLKGTHPEGKTYYWMGGLWKEHEEHEESDVALLRQGYITVVPIQTHELTDLKTLQERKHHFHSLLSSG